MSETAVVLLSGGLDSSVLLYHYVVGKGISVKALSVDYGQRHKREVGWAGFICKQLQDKGRDVEHKILDLGCLKSILASSSLTNRNIEVPEGHYAEESMKSTVVPNRNMILLSLASAWAISEKADFVAYAAHAGDHAIYPDCRLEFVSAMQTALFLADWHQVEIQRPFIRMSKSEIVRLGWTLRVPFELTWSCYKGGEKHCGKCGTCVERREAFSLAGVQDPTNYEGDQEG